MEMEIELTNQYVVVSDNPQILDTIIHADYMKVGENSNMLFYMAETRDHARQFIASIPLGYKIVKSRKRLDEANYRVFV